MLLEFRHGVENVTSNIKAKSVKTKTCKKLEVETAANIVNAK